MKNITNGYKESVYKFGREIDSKISYEIDGETIELSKSQLNSVTPVYKSDILKSVMKQLDIDSNVNIPIGTILNYQFGIKVNGTYEYINYGNYIVKSSEKQEDTYSWKITCYDKMLYAMKDYEAFDVTYPISVRDYINALCQHLGLTFKNANSEFANYNRIIQNEIYLNNAGESLGYTFRDVLDELAQVTGSIICINEDDDELEIRYVNDLISSTNEVEGTNININNNLSEDDFDLQLKGNTYQQTYTGKNLLDYSHTQSNNGIVPTYNSNGTLSFSGTPTSTWANITQRTSMNLPAGTYTLSIQEPISTGFVVRLYHDNSNYTDIGFGAGTKKVTRTLNSAVVSGYIWIHTMTVGQAVNVTGIKAQLESGSKATNWEPFVGGIASPNPDYPQNIENVTGLQTIEVEGKNLLPYPYTDTTKTVNGITFTDLGDGTIKVNGTASANASFRLLGSSSQQYTINGNYIYGGLTANIRVQVVHYNPGYTVLGNSIGSSAQINKNTYTTGYIEIVVQSGQVVNNQIIKPMLTSTQDNTWEKYVGETQSPNPSYPQPIENVTGLQKVNVCGKNLCNINFDEGTTLTRKMSGSELIMNGTTGGAGNLHYDNAMTLSAGTYTFSSKILSGSFERNNKDTAIYFRNASDNTLLFEIAGTLNYTRNTTITLTEETTLRLQIYTNGSGMVFNNLKIGIQLEIGSTATDYEEYKGQKYEINLGKNLFDKDNATIFSAFINGSTQKIGSTTNPKMTYIKCLPNTTYTISKSLGAVFQVATTTETPAVGVSAYQIMTSTSTIKTITTNSTAKYIAIWFYASADVGTYTQEEILDTIQIEVGSQATTYSPYFTPIELNKIGDYQDRIYKQNNKWYIEKKIGKIVLDGNENYSLNTEGFTITQSDWNNLTNNNCMSNSVLLSNYYKNYTTYANLVIQNYGIGIIYSNIKNLYIRNTDISSVANFKTWLTTHNTEIEYVLNEPETTEITNTDLIEQLESIELLKGTNNISVISGNISSPIKIEYVTGYEYIDEKYLKDINVNFGEKYGKVNSIVLSRASEADNVYIQDEKSIDKNGLCELKIKENQIMNFNDRSDYLPDLLEKLNGLEFYINDYVSTGITYFELGDKYRVKVGETYYPCLMLNDEVEITQGLVENIHTDMPETSQTDYKKADKTDRKLNQTYIIADKQRGEIEALTSATTTLQDEVNNRYTIEQVNQLIQNAETGVTNTFSEAGGNNIFRNTGLWFADDKVTEYIYPSSTTYPSSDLYPLSQQHYEFWDGYVEKIKNDNSSNLSSMLLKNGYVQQKQTVPNGNYTVSFKYKKLINVATCKAFINGVEYPLTQTTDTEFVTGYKDTEGHYVTQPLEVSNREIMVKFYTDADNACEIYDLMVNAGTVKLAYSQNQNETKTDTVNISKGITITSTDTDTIFKANADGIRTLNQNNNVLTEFTDTGMKTKKMEVNEEAQICGTLIKEVANQTWFTKL